MTAIPSKVLVRVDHGEPRRGELYDRHGGSRRRCAADDVETVTVLDRLTAAGLSREAIDRHLKADGITVNGELVTDLQTPAPLPARVVLQR